MRAREANCTALDFETTGSVPGYRNEPWQIGIVELQRGAIVPDTTLESLLRVGERPFNPHAPGRHGELRREIAAAPALTSLWSRLNPLLVGRPLIAHNVSTEKRMLSDCFPLHRFGPWIDTLPLSRYAFPHLRSYSLQHIVESLNLTADLDRLCPNRTWHDALYDAAASACLLQYLISLPEWQTVTVETLSQITSSSPRKK